MHPFMKDVWQPQLEVPQQDLGGDLDYDEDDDDEYYEDCENEEELDYDLNEEDMESNLLALSSSLKISNEEGDQGDCFGSTGLFTAMWELTTSRQLPHGELGVEAAAAAAWRKQRVIWRNFPSNHNNMLRPSRHHL